LIKGDTTPKDQLWTGNDTSVSSGSAVPTNTWTHVAVTINGNLTTFYINGQIAGAANQNRGNPIDNTTNNVCLGREQYSGSLPAGRWFFNGKLDDVRLYARALPPSEIQGIVSASGPSSPRITGIVMSGESLVLTGTNGLPFATYFLLTSTNVASPLTDWSVAATNTFGSSGEFSITNAPNGDAPNRFYALRLAAN
jgi:hypothetical protein